MVKPRSNRRRYRQIVQQEFGQRPITSLSQRERRRLFQEWNGLFRNPAVQRFNESYWQHRVRRTKRVPQSTEFGVRRQQAEQNKEVIDDILRR